MGSIVAFALGLVLAPAGVMAADMADAPDYTGSEICAECHKDIARAWAGSHHAMAWTEPEPGNVLGDFDGVRFEHRGVVTEFLQNPEGYAVETEDRDGTRRLYDVVGVAGIAPLQQYLLSPEEGRTQTLDVAWDAAKGQWYHVFPDQELVPGDALHWSGPYKSWEARCAECHATAYSRNYDAQADGYAPEFSEIGVGCEACHGPGSAHVEVVRAGGYAGFDFDPGVSAEAEIQQCAGCHSRREALADGNPQPGVPYHDSYNLALLRGGLYEADGTIRDEVYVYGSFLQSKMYAQGVRCSNCHEPHSGALRAEGNAVCTQCHGASGNIDFPSLRKALYDDPEHHFHEPDSDGAQCVSCHMAERVYMGIDARRDHGFRVPRPDLSVETGGPDACTDCHNDRGAEWAAAEVAARFPEPAFRGAHFGSVFAAARRDPGAALERLFGVAEDVALPGIVRATALDLMISVLDQEVAERAQGVLRDTNPLVRAAAVKLQRGVPPGERYAVLRPLVGDEFRSVRVAVASVLFDAPPPVDPGEAAALRGIMGEWQRSLSARADFPETHMNIGGFALATRNVPVADSAFAQAVALDPQLVDGWIMRARIRLAQGDEVAAAAVLDEALAANPGQPDLRAFREELGAR